MNEDIAGEEPDPPAIRRLTDARILFSLLLAAAIVLDLAVLATQGSSPALHALWGLLLLLSLVWGPPVVRILLGAVTLLATFGLGWMGLLIMVGGGGDGRRTPVGSEIYFLIVPVVLALAASAALLAQAVRDWKAPPETTGRVWLLWTVPLLLALLGWALMPGFQRRAVDKRRAAIEEEYEAQKRLMREVDAKYEAGRAAEAGQ